jgi:hypothetical protein
MTGYEYLLAKKLGCEFQKVFATAIPYKTSEEENLTNDFFEDCLINESLDWLKDFISHAPFLEIIKKLQYLRSLYPKKSFGNLFYKLLANTIYGLICQGLGGKRKFDTKTNDMTTLNAGLLSNPILAANITGFIRSVITETLNNINELGGSVISVTTDGFITDVADLEEKLLKINPEKTLFFRSYRLMRKALSDSPTAFELKNTEDKGILS